MNWDVVLQFLGWALPGGLGACVTWLLSRHLRRTREAKEVHDTYRLMYDDVSSTLSVLQEKNNELTETLDKIRTENMGLRRAVNALRKSLEVISTCRHYSDCPVRRELQVIPECGERVSDPPVKSRRVRQHSVVGRHVSEHDVRRRIRGQRADGTDSGGDRQPSDGSVVDVGDGSVGIDVDEDP